MEGPEEPPPLLLLPLLPLLPLLMEPMLAQGPPSQEQICALACEADMATMTPVNNARDILPHTRELDSITSLLGLMCAEPVHHANREADVVVPLVNVLLIDRANEVGAC